jgi:hypothetical protein
MTRGRGSRASGWFFPLLVLVDLARRADLHQPPASITPMRVGHGHRLGLVVRDIEDGRAEIGWMRFSSSRISARSLASSEDSGSSIR